MINMEHLNPLNPILPGPFRALNMSPSEIAIDLKFGVVLLSEKRAKC